MYQWKDESSYSRGERGTREPTVWRMSDLRLSVHRYLNLPGWYMSAHDDGIDKHELKATDAEDAKREALQTLVDARKRRLGAARNALTLHNRTAKKAKR